MLYRLFLSLIFFSLVSACSSITSQPDSVAKTTSYPERIEFCESAIVLVEHHFEGGDFHSCSVINEREIAIDIVPENIPINQSAWYAFRVSSKKPGRVNFRLNFFDGKARYWPKLSLDGKSWHRAETKDVYIDPDKKYMTLTAHLDRTPLWIAGQELLTNEYFHEWTRELANYEHVDTQLLGRSTLGRPIYSAHSGQSKETIFLLGRQHPPELTGTIAMREFVKEILSNSSLAAHFRQRFSLVIIPLINPDGVAKGYWRHNMNGKDLNRDWGPFAQKETQIIKTLLDKLTTDEHNIAGMLDFHSTYDNKFYTQRKEDVKDSIYFSGAWFKAVRTRLPNFDFDHSAGLVSEQANSKNYFYRTYGVPAITYELGDETDRAEIKRVTPIFAQEYMRQMLKRPQK